MSDGLVGPGSDPVTGDGEVEANKLPMSPLPTIFSRHWS